MTNIQEIARSYIHALERGVTGDELAAFFAPDVIAEEFPNRLLPNGMRRDLPALLQAAERGQKVMTSQRYEILNMVTSANQVAIEFNWVGTLAVPLGSIPAGGEMRGRFAVFLEFREGLIISSRNYDCFEPW